MSEQDKLDLSGVRQEYRRGELLESQLSSDPIEQFELWFSEAFGVEAEPNAMFLATADSAGTPSGRMMLLKAVESGAFVFFSNYASRKGRELDGNPRAALVFFWQKLERQVRVEGRVEKISQAESEAYFHSRPRSAQIGALASRQSESIESRSQLAKRFTDAEAKYASNPLPLPDYWGGYRLIPSVLEFWQGRPGRLHDRIVYIRQKDQSWKIQRLQP